MVLLAALGTVTIMRHFLTRRGPVLLGALITVATFGYLLAFAPALGFADESFTLYGAKRVLAGDALYRDTFDFITPLSFYYYAFFFALGGVTVSAARLAMAFGNALSALLVYVLALEVAAPLEAALAAMLFTAGCIPVWNVASPHWLSTTLCLAAATALLSHRWRDSTNLRPVVAGIFVGLCVCNQQQRGVALLAWLAVAVPVLASWTSTAEHPRHRLRELILALAAATAVTVVILGYAVWRSSLAEFVDATVRFVFTGYRNKNVGKIAWGGTAVLGASMLPASLPWLPRAVPIVLILETGALSVAVFRRHARPQAVRFALLLLATLMAASVLYYPDFIHIAFIAPFIFIVAAGLVHGARAALARRSRVLAAACVVALGVTAAATVAKGARSLHTQRAERPDRFSTAFGILSGPPLSQIVFEGLATAVRDVPPERRMLYSYPSDAWLYLALSARNPLPYLLVFPGYTQPAQYDRILDAIARRVPEFIVVNHWLVRSGDPVVAAVLRSYGEGTTLFPTYTLHRRPAGDGAP